MPHIIIKMLQGRTDEQKKAAAQQVAEALEKAIGCNGDHISVAVEDYTPQQWQDVFQTEVVESTHLFVEPHYDPKDVL
ncbi:MAG: 4-oxalocrotonate tautomerase family protein [Ruminococcus sp.]|nr:4-oxalocrotonate tautomerase family protein [Ruminococcus sp.]